MHVMHVRRPPAPGRSVRVSVPKVKCLACGTEWTGPVVFCGECGAVITAPSGAQPGERVARVPPPPMPPPIASAATPAAKTTGKARSMGDGKPTHAPEAHQTRPTEPELRRTVAGMPVVAPPAAAPGREPARTVVGMPAAKAALPPEPQRPPESVRGSRRDGKKGRRGLAMPTDEAAHDENEKLLEALDAGFDTITRPSAPFVSITPSTLPDVPGAQANGDRETVPASPASTRPKADEEPAKKADEAPSKKADVAPLLDEEKRRAQHESDMAEVRALFAEMAAVHARPLRDFMIEVSWGDPTREWLDIAVPAAMGLRRASDALEMPELGVALEGFSAALDLAAGEASIHREVKDLLAGAYTKLTELLPAAFALDGERGRREPIIVRALLLQVPGVRKVALDKIYAAGLVSLDMLYAAGPKDLAETTGLDLDLAARIHERLQRHRREAAALDPGRDRAAERAELATLVADLERAHDEHERAAASWSKDAAVTRASARKERNDLMLQVSVLLARMGEVDRLKALERATFANKIKDLRSFLDDSKRKGSRS